MSHVTNVMVTHCLLEPDEVTNRLDAPVPAYASHPQHLALQTGMETTWGGLKMPEVDLHAGAFNHLRWDEFAAWVAGLGWHHPGWVQVFVQGQEDDGFSVFGIRDGSLVRLLDQRELDPTAPRHLNA